MNNLLHKLKISAALFVLIILNGSVYSQNVISSANVGSNAELIGKQLTKNTTSTRLLENKSENWFSNKNYLDFSSSSLNVSFSLNEEVKEIDEIENWMIDESEWILQSPEPSKIEDWMLNCDFYKINVDLEEDSIEDWMTDGKFWLLVN